MTESNHAAVAIFAVKKCMEAATLQGEVATLGDAYQNLLESSQRQFDDMRAAHNARVSELLEANNALVERCRQAEREACDSEAAADAEARRVNELTAALAAATAPTHEEPREIWHGLDAAGHVAKRIDGPWRTISLDIIQWVAQGLRPARQDSGESNG